MVQAESQAADAVANPPRARSATLANLSDEGMGVT
jgi:hypothetical protein